MVGTAKEYQISTRARSAGQDKFRRDVLAAYGGRCCVTRESVPDVLQAAHIQDYVNESSHHVQNGLPLRLDLHGLFDAGLLTVDENYCIAISPWLQSAEYGRLAGQRLWLPKDKRHWPSQDALRVHRETKFRR